MTATGKKRDSNMELARIIAMTMIVVGHIFSHGLGVNGQPSPDILPALNGESLAILSIRAICTGGVSLFMLISGYYGIKLRWKSVISFYLLCIFYNAVSFFVNVAPDGITAKNIIDIFLISKIGHWFFQGYWWLLLTSPVINLALNKFNLQGLRLLEIIALILTCVSSCILANPKGNTVLFLYCLYFTGGYLRKEYIFDNLSKKSLAAIWTAVKILSIVTSVVVYNIFHKEYGIILQNNSPFVIISAIALFLFFRKLHFSSPFINVWASTIVAVLFLSDMIFYNNIYSYIGGVYDRYGLSLLFFTTIVGLIVAAFAASFIIEWPRKSIADKITTRISTKLDKWIDIEGMLLGEDDS